MKSEVPQEPEVRRKRQGISLQQKCGEALGYAGKAAWWAEKLTEACTLFGPALQKAHSALP